jgi:hypothetical protein
MVVIKKWRSSDLPVDLLHPLWSLKAGSPLSALETLEKEEMTTNDFLKTKAA